MIVNAYGAARTVSRSRRRNSRRDKPTSRSGADEVARRGNDVELIEARPPHDVGRRRLRDEQLVGRRAGFAGTNAESGRGAALRIAVDEQRALSVECERGGNVHGGRRLPNPALLVRDRDDAPHPRLQPPFC
jgi:hypothetical protein